MNLYKSIQFRALTITKEGLLGNTDNVVVKCPSVLEVQFLLPSSFDMVDHTNRDSSKTGPAPVVVDEALNSNKGSCLYREAWVQYVVFVSGNPCTQSESKHALCTLRSYRNVVLHNNIRYKYKRTNDLSLYVFESAEEYVEMCVWLFDGKFEKP